MNIIKKLKGCSKIWQLFHFISLLSFFSLCPFFFRYTFVFARNGGKAFVALAVLNNWFFHSQTFSKIKI